MPFDKIVGIDWSGAKDEHQGRKIQVAEYDPRTGTVRLVGPLPNPAAPWRRKDMLEYVRREVETSQVLIGFDFAFAYPYCDRQAYFPFDEEVPENCEQPEDYEQPAGFQHLWEMVEERCHRVPNLYGTPFIADGSPFRRYHRVPGYRGCCFQPRHRITEPAAQGLGLGLNPTSIFHCIGPNQVGIGSMAGMRLLHRLHCAVPIWPFDVNGPPQGSTVVEIYPRLFLNQAQREDGIGDDPGNIGELCAHFEANLQNPPGRPTGDQRDALVSAAGMGRLVRQGPNWQVPDCAATYEGWIFGV